MTYDVERYPNRRFGGQREDQVIEELLADERRWEPPQVETVVTDQGRGGEVVVHVES